MKTSTKKNALLISWGTVALVLLSSAFFLFQIRGKARMETNLDKYMPKEHPAFQYSDQAEEWFNIKDGILIALENREGIYNTGTLQKIKDITRQLQDMEAFEDNDVTSLYSADNIRGSEDGMEVDPFYTRVPTSEEKLELIRQNVRSNDMVYGRLVSLDETVALVVAGMNDSTFTEDFYEQILEFSASFADEENKVYVAGRPIVEGTMGLLGPADMKRMVPLVLGVIAVVLFLLLKSVRASAATLLSVFVSTVWAFGAMALLGIPIYSVSTMIPVMLIAIGVAYGIYFYNHLRTFVVQNPGSPRIEAIRHTRSMLWKPLSMAAFTTVIGFISLLSSQVYPIKYFGIFTAFGILVSFFLALSFLPAMVQILGYKARGRRIARGSDGNSTLLQMGDAMYRNRRWVYLTVILVLLVSVYGMQKVWINSSFLDKFEKDSDIVRTDAFVNSKFGGTSTLNVILEAESADAFKQPDNLRLIDRMQEETVKLPSVGNSFSLADYLKRMNKVMNADVEAHYTIPDSPELVAQYLLLYEMSGDPENLVKVSNYDYNKTNVTFQLKGDDSKTINEALAVIEGYRDAFGAQGIEMNYAGSGYKALVFTDLILEGQILSILLSLGMVLVLLTGMFRSVKAGLIGSLPIVITALISFGVMGLLNIPLSTTTALLSSIAIGIGIDYAIHFMQHYRLHLDESGDAQAALHATMELTGRAILYNAVVVISGFLVLLFSVFPPNRSLGALVSMNMATSLLGTLSIMMILLIVFRVFTKKKQQKQS